MDSVQFSNIDLERPIQYNEISDKITEKTLRRHLTSELSEAGIKNQFRVLYQSIDNCHGPLYKLFDVDSSDPTLQDYFGFAQLLKRNFWSGYYYCHRAEYYGRDRERLQTVRSRLEHYRNNTHAASQESPLYPVEDADSCSTETIIELYDRICDLEDTANRDDDTNLALAEANLSFASYILSNIYDTVTDTSNPIDNSSYQSYLPLLYLLTFQSERAKASASELEHTAGGDTDDMDFLPTRVAAHAAAMAGNYQEAARRISDSAPALLRENPSLIEEGYFFYRHAGDFTSAHEFITDYWESNALWQMALNRRQQVNQLNSRLRGVPPILVSSISKSGSSFLWNQVQDRLLLPSMKIFTTADYDKVEIRSQSLNQFAKGGVICRQHIPPKKEVFQQLAEAGIDRIVFHLRDPRRALISWVFYVETMLRKHSTAKTIPRTDPKEYARLDFQGKIEHQIEAFLQPTIRLIERWIEAQKEEPAGVSIKITRFEDMVSDPDAFFTELFSFYGVQEASRLGQLVSRVSNVVGMFLYIIENPVKVTRFTELFRAPANEDKKRGDDVDEWEEYFSEPLKQQVLDEISDPIRKLYPEHEWIV